MATINGAPYLLMEPPFVGVSRPAGVFDVSLGPMPFPVLPAQGGGVQYVPDTCNDDYWLYAMNCPPVSGMKTFVTNESPVSGGPFAVITSYTCGAIGYTFEEIEYKVRLRMQLREQRAVEARIWQGSPLGGIGGITGLFQSATAAGTGTSSCPTTAIADLEQTLVDNGVIGGIIHARPYMAAHLATSHLVERTAGPAGRLMFTTLRGTPIVFGEGYAGTGPTGQAVTSTTEYMYASGRIAIWQSDVQVPPLRETMDRTNNQQMALAERIYAVTVECGSWYTQVTRDCVTAGSAT